MSHATATKTAAPAAKSAAKKPAKKKVSAFSTRKVDPAYYWMAVPAAIIFAFFLYLPFLHQFAGIRRLQVHRPEELHRSLSRQPCGPRLPVHILHRHSHHSADQCDRPVPIGDAELEDRLQKRLPCHLLHSLHPLRASHRLRVQVHLHEPVARTWQGTRHQVAVHLAADQ